MFDDSSAFFTDDEVFLDASGEELVEDNEEFLDSYTDSFPVDAVFKAGHGRTLSGLKPVPCIANTTELGSLLPAAGHVATASSNMNGSIIPLLKSPHTTAITDEFVSEDIFVECNTDISALDDEYNEEMDNINEEAARVPEAKNKQTMIILQKEKEKDKLRRTLSWRSEYEQEITKAPTMNGNLSELKTAHGCISTGEFVSEEIFVECNTDLSGLDEEYNEEMDNSNEEEFRGPAQVPEANNEQTMFILEQEYLWAEKDKLRRTMSWHSEYGQEIKPETAWWTPQLSPLRFTKGLKPVNGIKPSLACMPYGISAEKEQDMLNSKSEENAWSPGAAPASTFMEPEMELPSNFLEEKLDDDDGINEEYDFRMQEIEVPEWAFHLFGLPHPGLWKLSEIVAYDSLGEAGSPTAPAAYEFREGGSPTAAIGYNPPPIVPDAFQPRIVKRGGWIKKLYRRTLGKINCFGGCIPSGDNVVYVL